MRFSRTEHFHDACNNFRAGLRAIWAAYDAEIQRLEKYRGSVGFEEEKTKAEKKRDAAIEAHQREYRDRFDNVIKGMKESATSRTMEAPTNEQVNLLQALKMRDKVSRDELEQAGRTLKGCPAALSVLDEIAQKNELYSMKFSTLSTAGVLRCIDSLADSAKRICALRKCDSRKEQVARASVHSPDHEENALYSFRVDTDVSSIKEALRVFGGVQDADAFAEIVNS